MRRTLLIHPASAGAGGLAMEAGVERGDGLLRLRFILTGPTARLSIPAPAPPVRTDGLWRTTCFEAFLGRAGEAAYCEFNLSPSGQWAAYRFDGYRQGMRALEPMSARQVNFELAGDGLELSAVLDLPPDLAAGPVRLGLSAIIEASGGEKSYWALAHPPGKPDFHHADCFAAELEAPRA